MLESLLRQAIVSSYSKVALTTAMDDDGVAWTVVQYGHVLYLTVISNLVR